MSWLFKRTTASPPRTRHNRPAPTPPQPVSPGRPDETALYAEAHPYLTTTIPLLRDRAAWCRAMADDHDVQANDLIGLASRLRIEAEDFDRLAALAEHDHTPLPAAPAAAPFPGPMAGQIVHYRDGGGFWPPCGARGEAATWATAEPEGVNCVGCLAKMRQGQTSAPPVTWSPRSVADLAGWSDAATTASMTVVPGGAR